MYRRGDSTRGGLSHAGWWAGICNSDWNHRGSGFGAGNLVCCTHNHKAGAVGEETCSSAQDLPCSSVQVKVPVHFWPCSSCLCSLLSNPADSSSMPTFLYLSASTNGRNHSVLPAAAAFFHFLCKSPLQLLNAHLPASLGFHQRQRPFWAL